jgi:3-dehydroshikimate dehydratase
MAGRHSVCVALEYHANTLTDTHASVRQILSDLDHPAIRFMWQPALGRSQREHRDELRQVLPRLANLHVFEWTSENGKRVVHPLRSGVEHWRVWLKSAHLARPEAWALIEFVLNDHPSQFLEDAVALRECVQPSSQDS